MLAAAVGASHVAGGVAHVFAVVSEPGVIRHTALDLIIVGELDGTKTPRLEKLHALAREAGFECRLSEQIEMEIWLKFVRLSAFSGMTAVTRSPLGIIRDDPDLLAMLQAAVMEGMAVAHAKQIQFPPDAWPTCSRTWPPCPRRASRRCWRISSAGAGWSCRG